MLEAICVHYIVWPVLRTSNAIFLTWYKTCMSVEQVESIVDAVVLFCEIYYINSTRILTVLIRKRIIT